MKHNKNSRYLPDHHQRGSSSAPVVDDGSSSLACDHRRALREMAREQSLVTQLRAVVLPALPADERSDVVAQMFQTILDCSAKAIAALKLRGAPPVVAVDDKTRVIRKKISDDNAKPHLQRKRRRLADDSATLETPVPHYDGHQWRKYGQKLINNAQHPRSYYRCNYGQEQDCRATKTVQQQEDNGGGARSADDPVMYAVVYYGQHTCTQAGVYTDAVVETASTGHSGAEHARSDSQCSNISVTCTSVVANHHSLESKLLDMDMAQDLTTAQVNKYEMFDMAAYAAALEFDTFEMDAHGNGLLKFGDW